MKGQKTLFSKHSDDWYTPQELFDELNKEFNFWIDLAASEQNSKCERYIDDIDEFSKPNESVKNFNDFIHHLLIFSKDVYSEKNYGQIKSSNQIIEGFCWCNPPYSKQRKFVEFSIKYELPTVFILPARTDTRLFHDLIYPYSNLVPERYLYSNSLKDNIKVSFASNYRVEVRFLKGRVKFKRGIEQIKAIEEKIKNLKFEYEYLERYEFLTEIQKLEKKLISNDGAGFPSMLVIYRPNN